MIFSNVSLPARCISIVEVRLFKILVERLKEPQQWPRVQLSLSREALQRVLPGLAGAQPQHPSQGSPGLWRAGEVTAVERTLVAGYLPVSVSSNYNYHPHMSHYQYLAQFVSKLKL